MEWPEIRKMISDETVPDEVIYQELRAAVANKIDRKGAVIAHSEAEQGEMDITRLLMHEKRQEVGKRLARDIADALKETLVHHDDPTAAKCSGDPKGAQ